MARGGDRGGDVFDIFDVFQFDNGPEKSYFLVNSTPRPNNHQSISCCTVSATVVGVAVIAAVPS